MKVTVLTVLALVAHCIKSAPVPDDSFELEDQPSKRIKLSSRCQLFFSEIKLGWKDDSNVAPFVELESTCVKRRGKPPKNALSVYTMIIVQSQPLSVVFVAKFDAFPHDGTDQFVVIGSPEVPNVRISTGTPHVQSIFSKTESRRMLPIPTENAYAMMILKDLNRYEANEFNLFYNLDAHLTSRMLTSDQIKLIASKLVDMVVVGELNQAQMEEFQYFWPDKSKPLISKAWNEIAAADIDMSMSLCTNDYNGFDSEAFSIKVQSPGEVNICNNLPQPIDDTIEPATPEPTLVHKIRHLMKDEDIEDVKKFEFNPLWKENCKQIFPKKSTILDNKEIQKWLKFDDKDVECKFTCKACQTYLKAGFRPDLKVKPTMMTSGFYSKDIYDNGDAVKKHQQHPVHLEAVEFLEKMKATTTSADVNNVISEFEEKEMVTFNATMNVVLMVYSQIKAGVSFNAHESIMKGMKLTGANIGTIQHTGDAAQSIATVIGASFRLKMLNHLVLENLPFSIMVDASSNFNLPFLAVYIQLLEDSYPTTHFYSLIYMSEGEKSKAMTNSFVQQISQDDKIVPGFENYFKSKLVSFSSDGAAVMVGDRNSFKVYLAAYVGRSIPNIICLTHRLDSAYKYGIKPDQITINSIARNDRNYNVIMWQYKYFESFETSMNELYNFYTSRGYKRWHHLMATGEEMGISPKRIIKVHIIRWSESHYQALLTIHHNYYAMVEDVDKIRFDDEFEENVRSKAQGLHDRLVDKTYIIVMHEFLDLLSSFKKASKKLQESSSTLVGKVEIVYDVLNELVDYKNNLGMWTLDFLKNTACVGVCDDGECTMRMFDDCYEVIINGLKLTHRFPVAIPYTVIRETFYNNMVAAIKKYFNFELLEAFQIFNPRRINFQPISANDREVAIDQLYNISPNSENYQVYNNHADRVKYICKFYNINKNKCQQFQQEWTTVVSCLSHDFDQREDSTRFWPLALTLCEDHWTPLTKEIVGYAMVTPYSSSEVERGFSVMNAIKTKGRSSMDKDTLDAVMTVKINGPEIQDFDAYSYTIEFLKKFARADDLTMKGGRKPAPETLPSMFKKSRIYK